MKKVFLNFNLSNKHVFLNTYCLRSCSSFNNASLNIIFIMKADTLLKRSIISISNAKTCEKQYCPILSDIALSSVRNFLINTMTKHFASINLYVSIACPFQTKHYRIPSFLHKFYSAQWENS